MRALILGADGQVGRALRAALPDATALDRHRLDVGRLEHASVAWDRYDVVVNAAAWTQVDEAETPEGRPRAWRTNALAPAELARLVAPHGAVLVHFSTEYVFDGRAPGPYREDDDVAPLGAYGASKAAGDLAVTRTERHYLVRPSWVVGDGHNFVRTMIGLAARGVEPEVVADQVGRPTFAEDLADAVVHLVRTGAPHGTYHVTGSGGPASWADVARAVYDLVGRADLRVTPTTTAAYGAGRTPFAPRPANSVLDLTKASAAGILLPEWRSRLARYLSGTGHPGAPRGHRPDPVGR